MTLFFTWKWKHLLKLVNISLLIVLCFLYSFCFYLMDNIEFSLFLNITIYIFSMHGVYIRMISILALSFYVLYINLINTYFKKDFDTSYEFTTQNEAMPDFTLPLLSILWIFYIIAFSLSIFWEEK